MKIQNGNPMKTFEAVYSCTIPHYCLRDKQKTLTYGVDQVKYTELVADESGRLINVPFVRDRVYVSDGEDITYINVEYYEEKYYDGVNKLKAWCDKSMPWLWENLDVIYSDTRINNK